MVEHRGKETVVDQYRNGVPAGSLDVVWVKSAKSSANGQCVELASLPAGRVAMRNSTDPAGPALVFTGPEFAAFLDGAQRGEFDLLMAAK
ncbi:transcriptional regulator [Streptomyces albus subsp. albus]|nr:transcriptional regulator [Streptomyces albus subsp. albus]